ncbi:MAG: LTA synthase family protein [Pseudomonadota bacterium]
MSFLFSRRLGFFAGGVAVLFVLLALLRVLFFVGFSGVDTQQNADAVWASLGVGLRFDMRLALLLMLPVAILLLLPYIRARFANAVRWAIRGYVLLLFPLLLLIYIFDFGHFAYLGVRLNASAFRFAADAQISTDMIWQTYPVVWITLGWCVTVAASLYVMFRLERATLVRSLPPVTRGSAWLGGTAVTVLVLLGLLGRYTNINIENPVPLRWSDAFVSGDSQIGALGLNPVLFLYDTWHVEEDTFNAQALAEHYPAVSRYFGLPASTGEPSFERHVGVQPHRLATAIAASSTRPRPPNVIFIMLESLGASAVGAYGNPLNPTPNLDKLATESWFFKHFYVPVTGTAKTVWASITGIPDVTRQETASRNPFIIRQHTLINDLAGYEKLYMVGGSAGWANINGLIMQSIDDVTLYEEGYWKAANADVWGISDLNLFKESDEILRALPADKPFFAYIQTAGNHRPFTIPEDNDGFEIADLSLEEVQEFGSRSVEQYNAVRLLDFNIGRFLEMAKAGGYYDNTIFVLYGDHNTRISQLPHMPPAFEQLGLESNHVPMMIFAPGLLAPREFDEAVGLADLLPTVAGLLGIEYTTRTMGRDLQLPAPEGERVVPVVLREGTFPLIGAVTKDFLVQMNHDGTDPSMHDLASLQPLENVADQHPQEYQRLLELARGLYETSRFMLYDNVRE